MHKLFFREMCHYDCHESCMLKVRSCFAQSSKKGGLRRRRGKTALCIELGKIYEVNRVDLSRPSSVVAAHLHQASYIRQ